MKYPIHLFNHLFLPHLQPVQPLPCTIIFSTGFRKLPNTSSREIVSILVTPVFVHKKEFLFLNSLKDFQKSLAEISQLSLFNNSNHLKDLVIRILWTLVMSFSDAQAMILAVILTVY
jgi:hypothetical protein